MIKITVELWPYGIEANKEVIGEMTIANDGTGTRYKGNYTFKVWSKGKLWKEGVITGFQRLRFNVWYLIVNCLIKALFKYKKGVGQSPIDNHRS